MADELAKAAVLLLLFTSVEASYWNREFVKGDLNKKYFLSTLPKLNDLEIPSVVWKMPICNKECQTKEQQVLLDLYRSLSGESWIHKWDIAVNGTASKTSLHCEWHGILCDGKTNHIIGIDLSYNNVCGELPVNASNVQFLLSFSIDYNPVSGQFEKIIASMPKNLVNLEMSNSRISGRIPKDVANNVPILSKLKISGSLVSGEIPETIGDLVYLKYLNLGETKINGSIPQSISRLKNLWYLDLETLRLKGNLSFLYSLRELRQLHLLSNQISGPIPEFIGERCPKLTELRLPNNKLSGQLPRSLGMLNKLEILNVEKNKLSGPLPAYLFKLNLRVLVLSSNKFTGFELNSNTAFRYLHIFRASNLPALNYSLDTIVSYLKGSEKTIIEIDVSHSNIYGQIPVSIFLFRRITILGLASNMLTGPIPAPWQNLPYLTVLDLQGNDLSGPIPMTFSRLLMLKELNLRGNKRLQGPVSSSFMVLDYQMKIKERPSDTCPMVRFAHNNGTIYVDSSYYDRKYCYCDEQYFGNGIHCTPCLQAGSCPGIPTSVSAMKELTADEVKLPASAMFLKQGYFPFPRDSDVKSIHKCPPSTYKGRICVPEENCGCYVTATEEKVGTARPVVTTLNHTRIYCNSSCLCRQGHHGRFCSQCIKGYYKNGIHCYKCYSKSMGPGVFAFYISGTIVIVFITISYYLRQCRLTRALVIVELIAIISLLFIKQTKFYAIFFLKVAIVLLYLALSDHLEKFTALGKSAMFYMQVMTSLISTTDIFPYYIYDVQKVTSAFNIHFSGLGCAFPGNSSPLAKSIILFLAPFLCFFLVALTFYGLKFMKKLCRKSTCCKCTCCKCTCCESICTCKFLELEDESSRNKWKRYLLNIFDFAYFPMAESCISVLIPCKNIGGVSFLQEFPWIGCSGSEYNLLFLMAIAQCLYVIIFSGILCYILYINKDLGTSSPTNTWLSQVFAHYKPRYRRFIEVYFVGRRLAIAVVMAYGIDSSLVALICIIILLLCIIIQALSRPYANPTKEAPSEEEYFGLENVVDIIMLSCMISTVCAGTFVGYESSKKLIICTIIVVANAAFLVMFVVIAFYRCCFQYFNVQQACQKAYIALQSCIPGRTETENCSVHTNPGVAWMQFKD